MFVRSTRYTHSILMTNLLEIGQLSYLNNNHFLKFNTFGYIFNVYEPAKLSSITCHSQGAIYNSRFIRHILHSKLSVE